MENLKQRLGDAIKSFWTIRDNQKKSQGQKSGIKDAGNRSAVTGGKQMDGFVSLISDLIGEAGLSDSEIYLKHAILPGYFRPTKDWDLIVVSNGRLIASVEFKSQVGSFGNNFNNRVEESIGSATDLWAAYREGAFRPSEKPWLGYFMMLEDHPKSKSPVKVSEPHFNVFPEFVNASYSERYELFCEKIVRERLYDASCFLLSNREEGINGNYSEPNIELSFNNFVSSLIARVAAFVKIIKSNA